MSTEYTAITVLTGEKPGLRHVSGMATYTEVLEDGRLLPILRSSSGRPKYQLDNVWESSKWLDKFIGRYPVESFSLEIDGQQLENHWTFSEAQEAGEEEQRGKHSLLSLSHAVKPVNVKIHSKLDGTPFLERWMEIENTGGKPAALSRISPVSGILWHMEDCRENFDGEAFEVGYYADTGFGFEGNFQWRPLTGGKFTIEGNRGRSGWGLPFFVLHNRVNGEYFFAHLEWSANWQAEFTVSCEPSEKGAMLCFKLGPCGPAPVKIIAPGGKINSPVVHFGLVHDNFDECVHKLHTHLRRSVLFTQDSGSFLRIGGARVVEGGEEWLKNEIDMAAQMGMEYFLVDAGWYGSEPGDWWNTVGDWNVGHWLPDGLGPGREYIHSKGMLFGLWMEAEAIGAKSNLIKEHPDWRVTRDGKPVTNGRLLDLSKPEVEEWVKWEVIRVIEEHKPDLFKLDFNCQEINCGGERIMDGYIENTHWGHIEALYRIFDRVRERFPGLLMENCAAGGGRNDLGMVRRFTNCAHSDYTVQPRGLFAVNNLTIAYPPEVFKYYFGHWPGYHLYGDFDFQLRAIMFSNPLFVGFGLKSEAVNETEKNKILHYVSLYKEFIRPVMPGCRVYHHTKALDFCSPHDWCALEYAAADGSRSYAGVFRIKCMGDNKYIFKPKGLNPGSIYKVALDNTGMSFGAPGWELMQKGIEVEIDAELHSELLLFEKVLT